MELSLVLLSLFALSGVQSQSDSECAITPPPVDEPCCKMNCPYKTFGLDKVIKECMDELKIDIKAPVNPGNDPMVECLQECLLTKAKLLTPNLALNDAAIKDVAIKSLTGPWADVGAKVIDECLKTAAGKVPKDAKCKSGSSQLLRCVNRGLFMNCPKENWTESGECTAQRTRLEKCPNGEPPIPKRIE